jgi:hypothetical protein
MFRSQALSRTAVLGAVVSSLGAGPDGNCSLANSFSPKQSDKLTTLPKSH